VDRRAGGLNRLVLAQGNDLDATLHVKTIVDRKRVEYPIAGRGIAKDDDRCFEHLVPSSLRNQGDSEYQRRRCFNIVKNAVRQAGLSGRASELLAR
jgi:hypothetical protein